MKLVNLSVYRNIFLWISICTASFFCIINTACGGECNESNCPSATSFCLPDGSCADIANYDVIWQSPTAADGKPVLINTPTFDVTLLVHMRALRGVVSLVRQTDFSQNTCIPIRIQEQEIFGSEAEDTEHVVTFRNIPASIDPVTLVATLTVESLVVSTQQTIFSSQEPDAILQNLGHQTPESVRNINVAGFDVTNDLAILDNTVIDSDNARYFLQSVPLQKYDQIAIQVRPIQGAPSPRIVFDGADFAKNEQLNLFVPLARGPQHVWIEGYNTNASGTRIDEYAVCGLPVTSSLSVQDEKSQVINQIDATIFSLDDVGSAIPADIWIYEEEPSIPPSSTGEIGYGICSAIQTTIDDCRTRSKGAAQTISFTVEEGGIYGLAVAPSQANLLRVMVRLSSGNTHLGWFGPFSLQGDRGHVWQAARLYFVEGQLAVENLDTIFARLPDVAPSAW